MELEIAKGKFVQHILCSLVRPDGQTTDMFFLKSGQNQEADRYRTRLSEDPDKNETRTGHEQCCPPTSGLKQEVQSLIFRLLFLRWLLRWVKSPLETALFNIRFLLRSSRSILFCRLSFLFAARSIFIFSLFKCRTSVGDFAISHLASISIKHTKITKI